MLVAIIEFILNVSHIILGIIAILALAGLGQVIFGGHYWVWLLVLTIIGIAYISDAHQKALDKKYNQ